MARKIKRLPPKYQMWVDARKKFNLSHAHTQMARELGMNPKKLGGLANHDQELWKLPLPHFIEDLYFKSFGRDRPEIVMTIEQSHSKKKGKRRDPVLPEDVSEGKLEDDCDECPF